MSETTTMPGQLTQLSGETLPIGIDFRQLVPKGQSVSTPTAALWDITDDSDGTPVSLTGSPSLSGLIVTQVVSGLLKEHRYRLVLGLTSSAGVVWQAGVVIPCPF